VRLRFHAFDARVAEHVRVSTLELVGDRGGHGFEVEQPALLGDAGLKDDLEQHVAEFVADGVDVGARDGVRELVRFLDRVRRDRGPVLLPVPGTTEPGVTQSLHDAQQALELGHARTEPSSRDSVSSIVAVAPQICRSW
jgi:hypothetical protein